MAQTPTDPTKAQAWITGTPPDLEMELYIPRGSKGEPGGIVLGTLLGTANLNSIFTPGTYRQTAGADATLLRNYPKANLSGLMNVYGRDSNVVIQQYMPIDGTSGVPIMYQRLSLNATSWLPWRVFSTVRVDQTAGRAIYQWDDLNNREQLIYGDTGQRSIVSDQGWVDALIVTNVAMNAGGIARVRRIGYQVELILALDKSATGSISSTVAFPVGFRPSQPFNALGSNSGMALLRAYHGGGTSGINWNSSAVALAASITINYTTTDAWPTVLPGTAIGSIPNV